MYSFFSYKLEMLCCYQTEYDPVCVVFSTVESNVLYSIEEKISATVYFYVLLFQILYVKFSSFFRFLIYLSKKCCKLPLVHLFIEIKL